MIDNLVQFEEDFNSRTKKLRWGGVGSGCYLRPDHLLDHLTVIKMTICQLNDLTEYEYFSFDVGH